MNRCLVRRARRGYRCDGETSDCARHIGIGEKYVYSVISPNHDGLGNPGWWGMRLCAQCVQFFTDIPADVKVAVNA